MTRAHVNLKNKVSMSFRLFASFYTSLFLHLVLILMALYPHAKSQKLVCGYHVLILEAEEEEEFSFNLDFSVEKGDGAPESAGEKPSSGTDSKEKGEPGKDQGLSSKQLADLEKRGWKDLLKRLKDTKNLREGTINTFDNIIRDGSVSDSYIFRDRYYEDIIVKEVFPTVHTIDKNFKDEIKNSVEELEKHEERNEIIKKFRHEIEEDPERMTVSTKDAPPSKDKKPLAISQEERDKYFDETLTLPKEEQMSDFIDKFGSYDPDKGDLPMMYRELYYKNLQRLAYSFSADQSYFSIDYFQENLNKEDYLKNSMALASEMKGTKTASEILFTIENIYEIQSNALSHYFTSRDNYQNLTPDQKKQLRVETLKRVVERYAPILKEKNIKDHNDVLKLYYKKRIEIMDYLLSTTPDNYRRADALFEKGRILWDKYQRLGDEKDMNAAVATWESIGNATTGSDFINEKAYKNMQPLIRDLKSFNPNTSMNAKSQITMNLYARFSDILNDKKLREDKLLWKKK